MNAAVSFIAFFEILRFYCSRPQPQGISLFDEGSTRVVFFFNAHVVRVLFVAHSCKALNKGREIMSK